MSARRAFPSRDPGPALRAARTFYRSHGLEEWVTGLPKSTRLSVPRTTGLDAAFFFPPVPVQVATLTLLFETLATRPVRRLPDEVQYGEPAISDLHALRLSSPRNRPVGPYLLVFRSRGIPPETAGVAPGTLDRQFRDRGRTGLSIPEYLVLQRVAAESWLDHRFHEPETRAGPQAQWLLDAGVPGAHTAAHWNTAKRRLEMHLGARDAAEPGRGAHETVVVPL